MAAKTQHGSSTGVDGESPLLFKGSCSSCCSTFAGHGDIAQRLPDENGRLCIHRKMVMA